MLNALGTPYRIVSTAADFESEMRCGKYNVYWISGGANKLSAQAAKELRETVRRGEGLIEDGEFDDRSHLFEGVAGVIHRVDLPAQNNSATVPPGSAFDPGTLATVGTAVGFSLTTGQAVAQFSASAGEPAIVLNRYGEGTSVLHAFSLAAALAAPGGATNAQLKALVQDSLDSVANSPGALTAGDLTRLTTSVANRGTQAVAIEARATLPSSASGGVSFIDAVPAAQVIAATATTPAQVVWRQSLAAGATAELQLRVRLDADARSTLQLPVAVGARLASASTSSAYAAQGSVTHTLVTEQSASLGNAALAALNALAPTSSADRSAKTKALSAANTALSQLQQNNAAGALGQWIKAADGIAGITSEGAARLAAAQLAVARALEAASDRLCGHCRP